MALLDVVHAYARTRQRLIQHYRIGQQVGAGDDGRQAVHMADMINLLGCAGTAILQAPYVLDASLAEDGGQVRFGDVIDKSAVAEYAGAIAGRGLRLVPSDNSLSKVFQFSGRG